MITMLRNLLTASCLCLGTLPSFGAEPAYVRATGSAQSLEETSRGSTSPPSSPQHVALPPTSLKLAKRDAAETTTLGSQPMRMLGGTLLAGGGLLVLAYLTRGMRGNTRRSLPSPVAEVLGYLPFPGRAPLQLIKLGNKLVLVATDGNTVQTVAEVTDGEEVSRLANICCGRESATAKSAGSEAQPKSQDFLTHWQKTTELARSAT